MKFEFLRIKDFGDCKDDFENKLFLTFDIDWASDEVFNYTIDQIEMYDISATFFVTHTTPVLERLRKNQKMELGIHPNFSFLMNGDYRYGRNCEEVIDYYMKIVPEAVSARSHALVQGTEILDIYHKKGIKYDLNLLIPRSSQIELKPIQIWLDDFIRLPYFWEDDTSIYMNESNDASLYLNTSGLKIFDFHPIHIFLNTEKMDRYVKAKEFFRDYYNLKNCINQGGPGTTNFFHELLKKANGK